MNGSYHIYHSRETYAMKRILTIQDISCLGRCSLTVALPIISAMGVETCIVPTAVLSTHTMFNNFTFKDLNDQIEPIANHWKDENITFDAIYTGYLGSIEQIDIVAGVFDRFKTDDNLIIVDPAMADNGKLYPAFDEAFAKKMVTLCSKADIIVPNLTEASFMTGVEYRETQDEEYIKEMLLALSKIGAPVSVLTGVMLEEGKIGVMGYDSRTKEFFHYYNTLYPLFSHGTGDIFASTCVGALMNDKSVEESFAIAVDYTGETIRLTSMDPERRNYGVNFEQAIPYLLDRIK